MRDQTGPDSRRFTFKSSTKVDSTHIAIAGGGTAGDPTVDGATGGGATIVVYNSNGSGEKVDLSLPASGWTINAKGYRFKAPASTDPIQRVTVKNDSVRVRGGRAGFTYTLDEPSQGRVAVRLRLGTGTTWCAEAPAKTGTTYDVPGKFVGASKAPAPAVCPAVP
jgi:hypothetical protein